MAVGTCGGFVEGSFAVSLLEGTCHMPVLPKVYTLLLLELTQHSKTLILIAARWRLLAMITNETYLTWRRIPQYRQLNFRFTVQSLTDFSEAWRLMLMGPFPTLLAGTQGIHNRRLLADGAGAPLRCHRHAHPCD